MFGLPIWLFAILYLLFVSGCFYLCFCSSGGGDSFVGRVQYFLTTYPLKLVESIPFCGPAIVSCGKGTINYVVHSRNPLLQMVYGGLIMGGYTIYLVRYSHMVPNKYLSIVHVYLPHAIVGVTMYSFYLASTKQPGVITKKTFKTFDHHEYDGFLYVRHRGCRTCKTPKCARSKHCNLCGHCVARFDHHCPWINICVGEDNYRYFLLFLFLTMVLLMYATFLLGLLLFSEMNRLNIWKATYRNPATGSRETAGLFVILQYMFFHYVDLCGLLLLSVVMGVVMFFFLGYHLYLIARGTTTNETAKWGEINYVYGNKKKCIENCKKWMAKNDLGREICPTKDLLNPEKAPAFQERLVIEFPDKRPPNIYNYGIRMNFSKVFFPHEHQQGDAMDRVVRAQHLSKKKNK
mmetsp:Transcript_960/g.1244  ORF Transcript_960/g.1244 Transcript_960/m.1244 type:complete len:405 (+) Transcript_960:78-1292(+)